MFLTLLRLDREIVVEMWIHSDERNHDADLAASSLSAVESLMQRDAQYEHLASTHVSSAQRMVS